MAVQPFIPPEWPIVYTLVVGQTWPAADEDAVRRCAQAWTDAMSSLVQISGQGGQAGQNVHYSVQSVSSDDFDKYWTQYTTGDDSAVGQLAQQCLLLAGELLQFAENTEFTKISIDIQLIILMIQVAFDLFISPATAGLSMGEAFASMFMTKIAVREILAKLVEAVVMAVLPDVITQGVMLADGHRSDFSWGEAAQAAQMGVIGTVAGMGVGAVLGGLGGGLSKTLGTGIGGLVNAALTGAVTNVVTNAAVSTVDSLETSLSGGQPGADGQQGYADEKSGENPLNAILNGAFTGALFHGIHEVSAKPNVHFATPEGTFTGVKTGDNSFTLFPETGPDAGQMHLGTLADDGTLKINKIAGEPFETTPTAMSETSHGATTYSTFDENGQQVTGQVDRVSNGSGDFTYTKDGESWTAPKNAVVSHDPVGDNYQVNHTEGSKQLVYASGSDKNFSYVGHTESAPGGTKYFDTHGDPTDGPGFGAALAQAQQPTPPPQTVNSPASTEPAPTEPHPTEQAASQPVPAGQPSAPHAPAQPEPGPSGSVTAVLSPSPVTQVLPETTGQSNGVLAAADPVEVPIGPVLTDPTIEPVFQAPSTAPASDPDRAAGPAVVPLVPRAEASTGETVASGEGDDTTIRRGTGPTKPIEPGSGRPARPRSQGDPAEENIPTAPGVGEVSTVAEKGLPTPPDVAEVPKVVEEGLPTAPGAGEVPTVVDVAGAARPEENIPTESGRPRYDGDTGLLVDDPELDTKRRAWFAEQPTAQFDGRTGAPLAPAGERPPTPRAVTEPDPTAVRLPGGPDAGDPGVHAAGTRRDGNPYGGDTFDGDTFDGDTGVRLDDPEFAAKREAWFAEQSTAHFDGQTGAPLAEDGDGSLSAVDFTELGRSPGGAGENYWTRPEDTPPWMADLTPREQAAIQRKLDQGEARFLDALDPVRRNLFDKIHDEVLARDARVRRQLNDAFGKRSGGRLVGEDNFRKRSPSIDEKIRKLDPRLRDRAFALANDPARLLAEFSGDLNDLQRYTATYPKENYVRGTLDQLRSLSAKGYRLFDGPGRPVRALLTADGGLAEGKYVKNFWREGNRYEGLNTTLVGPRGEVFELQFHTPESFRLKQNLTEGMYKVASAGDHVAPRRKFNALQELVAVNRKYLEPLPDGIEAFGRAKDATFGKLVGELHDRASPAERATLDLMASQMDEPRPVGLGGTGEHPLPGGHLHEVVAESTPDHRVFDLVAEDGQGEPSRVRLDRTPSGWSLHTEGEVGAELNERAAAMAHEDGFVNLVAHATPEGFLLDGHVVPFKEAIDRLELPENDDAVRLIACEAGGGEAAAQLAVALDRPVVAADKPVWLTRNGEVVSASPIDPFHDPYPRRPPDGVWKVFTPDGRATELPEGDPYRPHPPEGWEAGRGSGEAELAAAGSVQSILNPDLPRPGEDSLLSLGVFNAADEVENRRNEVEMNIALHEAMDKIITEHRRDDSKVVALAHLVDDEMLRVLAPLTVHLPEAFWERLGHQASAEFVARGVDFILVNGVAVRESLFFKSGPWWDRVVASAKLASTADALGKLSPEDEQVAAAQSHFAEATLSRYFGRSELASDLEPVQRVIAAHESETGPAEVDLSLAAAALPEPGEGSDDGASGATTGGDERSGSDGGGSPPGRTGKKAHAPVGPESSDRMFDPRTHRIAIPNVTRKGSGEITGGGYDDIVKRFDHFDQQFTGKPERVNLLDVMWKFVGFGVGGSTESGLSPRLAPLIEAARGLDPEFRDLTSDRPGDGGVMVPSKVMELIADNKRLVKSAGGQLVGVVAATAELVYGLEAERYTEASPINLMALDLAHEDHLAKRVDSPGAGLRMALKDHNIMSGDGVNKITDRVRLAQASQRNVVSQRGADGTLLVRRFSDAAFKAEADAINKGEVSGAKILEFQKSERIVMVRYADLLDTLAGKQGSSDSLVHDLLSTDRSRCQNAVHEILAQLRQRLRLQE